MSTNDCRGALYGLQGMHSGFKEVNDLIAAFAGKWLLINIPPLQYQ